MSGLEGRPAFGMLNIAKPTGITSRHVVDRVERLVRPAKAGHAGTLDPLATGVLVVCVGPATRLIQWVQQLPKRYEATFLLGRTSTTEDIAGDVELLRDAPIPSLAQIDEARATFIGTVSQRPPAYSAVKVNGRRAYALARAGQQVELSARPVTIHSIRIERYEYPELELAIECGSGTYIRSLGRDLAELVRSGAVMASLARTHIGPFRLDTALPLDRLTSDSLAEAMVSPLVALVDMPRVELTAEDAVRIGQGLPIEGPSGMHAAEMAAVDAAGQLLAIVVPGEPGLLRARRYFPSTP